MFVVEKHLSFFFSLPLYNSPSHPSGSDIPGQASLVFDVVLLDLHNPRDGITVTNQIVPDSCTRKSVSGDFVRYHYNGSLLDGTFFDSRWMLNKSSDPL